MSKRQQLTTAARRLGLTALLEHLPSKPGILILNHHSIADRAANPFDRGITSATPDQLDAQLTYLKRHFPILSGDDLTEAILSNRPLKRLHLALTFDDGYLDNFTTVLPLLQSHGVRATFFLVSSFVGTNTIPWWDEIAFLLRHQPNPPADPEPQIRAALRRYASSPPADQAAQLAALRAETQVTIPPQPRRFLNWDEARQLVAAGMSIGAHTHTHPVLAHLPPATQREELQQCKSILEAQLNIPITTLAYPVGGVEAFTPTTEKIATEVGFRVAYSFYGALNTPAHTSPTSVSRIEPSADPSLFRFETAFLSRTGRRPF